MKPLVQNAADQAQVKKAENKILNGRDQELKDLREVMETRAGRNFIYRVLAYCRTFETIWDPSSRIHFNAGLQDCGHFLMREIDEAHPDAYFTMMKEKQKERN